MADLAACRELQRSLIMDIQRLDRTLEVLQTTSTIQAATASAQQASQQTSHEVFQMTAAGVRNSFVQFEASQQVLLGELKKMHAEHYEMHTVQQCMIGELSNLQKSQQAMLETFQKSQQMMLETFQASQHALAVEFKELNAKHYDMHVTQQIVIREFQASQQAIMSAANGLQAKLASEVARLDIGNAEVRSVLEAAGAIAPRRQ